MQSSQEAAMHKINYQLIVLHCVLMQRPLNAAEKEHGALPLLRGLPAKPRAQLKEMWVCKKALNKWKPYSAW